MLHNMEMAREIGDPSAEKIAGARKGAFGRLVHLHAGEKEQSSFATETTERHDRPQGQLRSESSDNHFHYGYFTYAASKLAAVDRPSRTDYGPMAKLVAKQVTPNWEREE